MKPSHQALPAVILTAWFFSISPIQAQDAAKPRSETTQTGEITRLRAELARLQTTIDKQSGNHKTHTSDPDNSAAPASEMKKGMEMGKDKKGMKMGMKGKEMGMKKMQSSSGASGMKMDGGKDMGMMKRMGMNMMGKMPNRQMSQSALPGFPGASHIYHIGSTGFFLDHGEHISLSAEQQEDLNKIKEASIMAQNEFDRQLERAEEELWKVTSAPEPNATAIEKKLSEIGTMTTKKRLSFIYSVGKAAEILSEDQRKILTGHASTSETPSAAHADHKGK